MIAILVLLLTLGWSSTLLAQAPFYQGKTISILVGTKTGDVYNLYPRQLAEFWTKYIPGTVAHSRSSLRLRATTSGGVL